MATVRRALTYTFLSVVTTFLASCSGGGGGGGGGSQPSFLSWNGSANGTIVFGANGVQVQFRADNRELFYLGNTYSNVTVDSQARIISSGVATGVVTLGTSTSGTQIAELVCNTGGLMGIVQNGNTVQTSCSGGGGVCGTLITCTQKCALLGAGDAPPFCGLPAFGDPCCSCAVPSVPGQPGICTGVFKGGQFLPSSACGTTCVTP
jgi:hypothetical protein